MKQNKYILLQNQPNFIKNIEIKKIEINTKIQEINGCRHIFFSVVIDDAWFVFQKVHCTF